MGKAYQLLNEYKHWTPRTYVPKASGIAFSQKTTETKARKEEWKKKATCHMCGKKGHIQPECPLKEDDQVDEQVEVDKSPDQKQPKQKFNLKKKSIQFVATTTDDEGSSSSEVRTTQFGFYTVATSPKDL